MTKYILPLIPKHTSYVEPFLGGGAVFWAKEPSPVEVLNDYNSHVMNFYAVLQTDFETLNQLVQTTLHSRSTHKAASAMYHMPELFTPLQRAWAFWVVTSQGFSSCIGGWSYSRSNKKSKTIVNKKKQWNEELSERLEYVTLECRDALKVIEKWDAEDTFFYIDPPYIGAHQGHYSGYTDDDFQQLLEILASLKGMFLLSSYQSDMLQSFTTANNWSTQMIEKPLTASKASQSGNTRKTKIEVLTMNYTL